MTLRVLTKVLYMKIRTADIMTMITTMMTMMKFMERCTRILMDIQDPNQVNIRYMKLLDMETMEQ